MAISNFSGKSSFLDNKSWEKFESGSVAWPDFSSFDQEAIVCHYAPKIRFLASRLKAKLPKNIELSDLISAGSLGLMEALRRFRPQLGIRFETYAENRIKGAMLDELRKLDWFSRTLRQRIRQIDEASWKIENEKGCPATEEELHEVTGLAIKDIRIGLEALQNNAFLSLDVIQDTVAHHTSEKEGAPYEDTAATEIVDRVSKLIDTLTDREKLVLSLYYSDELNMSEAASVMGVTEGRVSQLHSQALTRLRREFLNQYGKVD